MNRRLIFLNICAVLCIAAIRCTPASISASPAFTPFVRSATPIASIPFTPMDPETIAAQLTPVTSLSQAAEQLARILGTTADVARVRIEGPVDPRTCATCDRPPVDAAGPQFERIPADEAALHLLPGSAVWLAVQDVVCLYVYDGRELKPVSVRRMVSR